MCPIRRKTPSQRFLDPSQLGEEPITDILSTLLPNVLLAIMFFATLPPRFIGHVTNNKIEWVTPAKYKQDGASVFLDIEWVTPARYKQDVANIVLYEDQN